MDNDKGCGKHVLIGRKVITMLYSICELNDIMKRGTDHPLLTVIDKPEMFDCGNCAFHVIVFRANTSRENEKFGRSPNDFRAGTITFYAPGHKLDLTDCIGIIAFDNDYFGGAANEYPYFHFNEEESLHISAGDLQKWQDVALMLKKELQENIDTATKSLLRDGLHALLDLAQRFYIHQIYLRERLYRNIPDNAERMVSESFNAGKRLPATSVMAKRMGMSSAYLDEVMTVMTGGNTAEFKKTWTMSHRPQMTVMHK